MSTLQYSRAPYVLDNTEAATRARGQRVDVYESHDGAAEKPMLTPTIS